MAEDNSTRLRKRALTMRDRGWSLYDVLHFVRERLPHSSRLDPEETERAINDIVERRRRWRLNDQQAIDEFLQVTAF